LESGDAFSAAADFEVHVAEVIFIAEDVGKHADFVAFFDESHGDTRDRGGDGYAGVHEAQGAAADGGHGTGAVAFGDFGDNANGVGESGLGIGRLFEFFLGEGKHALEGAFGELPVADFASSGTGDPADFADGPGGEVVVEHEAAEGGTGEFIEALLVAAGSQGGGDQGLGFTAREECRAMGPREHAHFDGNRPDVFKASSIDATISGHNLIAQDAFFEVIKNVKNHGLAFGEEFLAVFGG